MVGVLDRHFSRRPSPISRIDRPTIPSRKVHCPCGALPSDDNTRAGYQRRIVPSNDAIRAVHRNRPGPMARGLLEAFAVVLFKALPQSGPPPIAGNPPLGTPPLRLMHHHV